MRKNKNNLMFIIIILFVVALGIGYAVLTEKLTINNTVSYGETKQIVASYSVGSLTPDNLPENGATININMEVNWIEKTN